MNHHILGGIIVAAVAILVGLGWAGGALLTRRHRAEFASTYGESGGIVYTVAQFGCAGGLMLAGLLILALVLVSRG
ncbi:MAG: hypothetical protein ACREPA_02240 [Candidatus Dormibacteraceae bacterium]